MSQLALILSQVLALASSTSSFVVSNVMEKRNVDEVKGGAWEYMEDKIKRFNGAKNRAKGEAEECDRRTEEGGGVWCFW